MSMNLAQLKAKYAKEVATGAAIKGAATAGKAWDVTKDVASKTGSVVKGVMPVTNNTFSKYAQDFNARIDRVDERLDTHDFELFKLQVTQEIIAMQAGIELPSEELLQEYYADHLKELEAQRKAAEAPKTEEPKEELAGAVKTILNFLGLSMEKAADSLRGAVTPSKKEEKETPAEAPAVDPLSPEAVKQRRLEASRKAQAEAKAKEAEAEIEARIRAEVEAKVRAEMEANQPEEEEKPAPKPKASGRKNNKKKDEESKKRGGRRKLNANREPLADDEA